MRLGNEAGLNSIQVGTPIVFSLVPSPTPSFSSLLTASDEKLGVGLGTRLYCIPSPPIRCSTIIG